jgi:hypothetical protein
VKEFMAEPTTLFFSPQFSNDGDELDIESQVENTRAP